MRCYKNIALIFFLMALTLVVSSSCSKKKTPTADVTPAPSDDNQNNPNSGGDDFDAPDNVRICPDQIIQNLSLTALEAYLFRPISDPEDGASWCMKLYGTSKNFDAALRVEVEDDSGVISYNLLSEYIVYSEIKDGNMHLLWLDDAGFVEVKGYRQPNNSWRTRLRFANLPEQSEIKTQSLDDLYSDMFKKCKNGTYNFSQCWGTHIIQYPAWPTNNGQLTGEELLKYAAEYLNGQHGADAHTLGYMNFNLSSVVVNQ